MFLLQFKLLAKNFMCQIHFYECPFKLLANSCVKYIGKPFKSRRFGNFLFVISGCQKIGAGDRLDKPGESNDQLTY